MTSMLPGPVGRIRVAHQCQIPNFFRLLAAATVLLAAFSGEAPLGAGPEEKAYTDEQLRDQSFVTAEIERLGVQAKELKEAMKRASPLRVTTLQREAARVEEKLELLRYVQSRGYDPADPDLQKLRYFKKSREVEVTKGLGLRDYDFREPPPPFNGMKRTMPFDLTTGGSSEIDLMQYRIPGATTVVLFTTNGCYECGQMGNVLSWLHKNDPAFALMIIWLNPGQRTIDFLSPLARQFGIDKLPFLIVYSPEGMRLAEGQEARVFVTKLVKDRRVLEEMHKRKLYAVWPD